VITPSLPISCDVKNGKHQEAILAIQLFPKLPSITAVAAQKLVGSALSHIAFVPVSSSLPLS